jgi:restriction endonuclease S subunit
VVHSGDLVYNPYRVNIGSIGIVPPYLNGYLASPAYIVFYSNSIFPNYYLLTMLKHKRFQDIIMSYCLGSARANLPFSELERIAIPEPTNEEITKILELGKNLSNSQQKTHFYNDQINQYSKLLIND